MKRLMSKHLTESAMKKGSVSADGSEFTYVYQHQSEKCYCS
jgi:hypothetical protein